jgi:MFS family permease
MQTTQIPESIQVSASAASRARYALSILTLIYAVGQLDRQVISLLLTGIKRDMHLSDTVLGLVSGFGFAGLYAISGIVASRWADRGPRRAIIAGGLMLYSAMTALAGFSRNVVQLAVTRVGVSIGESSGLAPSMAFLSDFYPNKSRGRALAIFAGGSYLSTLIGFPIAGWINQSYGWRPAFMAAGVPGIVLALLLRFTVADPARGGTEIKTADTSVVPFFETLKFLMRQRSVVFLYLGAIFTGWTLFTMLIWEPTFLERVHHMTSLEIGGYTGPIRGISALAGSIVGGILADRVGKRSDKLKLLVPVLGYVLACPTMLVFLFTPSLRVMFPVMAVNYFLIAIPMGGMWATLQSVAKVRMRALASALFLALANFVGLGIGPLVTGMVSDHLTPMMGGEAIRYSLIVPCVTSAVGGLLMVVASFSVEKDRTRALEA